MLHAIERSPRNRYNNAKELLADLEDPSRVVVTGRVGHLHPPASWQRFKAVIMAGVFFVSLIAIFVLLVWLARRYPAAPARTQGAYRRGRFGDSLQASPDGHRCRRHVADGNQGLRREPRGRGRAIADLAWVLVAGFLVMFMQVGFAMLETGFTRAKNAVNTMAMNLVISPLWNCSGFSFLTGYGLMLGGVSRYVPRWVPPRSPIGN